MGLKDAVGRVRRLGHLEERVAELEGRVAELEAEVQECRQVNLRLAELTDVVAELLLPVAQRDESRVDEVLRRYHDSVGVPPS